MCIVIVNTMSLDIIKWKIQPRQQQSEINDSIHWPKINLYYLITTMVSIFKELIYCKHCCSVFWIILKCKDGKDCCLSNGKAPR
jgi:hypothetical protein